MTIKLKHNPRTVVTGAASGLGLAFCKEILDRGGKVLAADLNEEGLRDLAQSLGNPANLATKTCNVSNAQEVEALAVESESLWGGTDLVINNAGVSAAGSVGEVSLADWQWVVGVNLWGVIHGCHSFVPRMKAAKSGWVLNVSSLAGLLGTSQMATYHTTKFAVVGLSESLRTELDGTGVGVSVLCPSFFKTNIISSGREAGADGERAKRIATKLMDASKITANEVADFALTGAENGTFFLIPQAEARWAWRVKRSIPELFPRLMSAALKRM